jgi:hypothetical protein
MDDQNQNTEQNSSTSAQAGMIPVNTTQSTSLPGMDVSQPASDLDTSRKAALEAAKGLTKATQVVSGMKSDAANESIGNQEQNISDLRDAHALELQRTQDALNDLKTASQAEINPQRYIQNMSTGQKVLSGIGLLLSGFGGADSAGKAYGVIDKGIQNDIAAQMSNRQSKMIGASESVKIAGSAGSQALDYFSKMGVANQVMYKTHLDAVDAYLQQIMASPVGQNPNTASLLQQLQSEIYNKKAITEADIAAKVGTHVTTQTIRGALPGASDIMQKIQYLPQNQQSEAVKELGEYQLVQNKMNDVDRIFPQLQALANYTHFVSPDSKSVRQSSRQYDAISGPFIDKLTKDATGRVVPTSIELIKQALPVVGDSKETVKTKMDSIKTVIRDMAKTPILSGNNIIPAQAAAAGTTRMQGPDGKWYKVQQGQEEAFKASFNNK